MAVTSATGRPSRTTWAERSVPGLSRTGFIAASHSMPAAAACIACARPISAPSGVTAELFDMFCALNGATETPCRCSQRHRPATRTLLPASEVVPATRIAPLTGGIPAAPTASTAAAGRRSRDRRTARAMSATSGARPPAPSTGRASARPA